MITVNLTGLDYESGIQLLTSFLNKNERLDIRIDFGADHKNSKTIRDFIGHIFDVYNINNPWKGRFVLITDELVNNAIEHGSQPGDTDFIVIEAGEDSQGIFSIIIEVHDTGNGKDAKDASHMSEIRKDRIQKGEGEKSIYMEKRGRGLFYITEKIVDRLSFSESPIGGLAVKIEKNITPILKEN